MDTRFITTAEISNVDMGFTPTSVYLDNVQTFDYTVQDGIIYFNIMVPSGTLVTAIPPDAVRFIDDNIVTLTISEAGIHSVFASPFGSLLFSSDGIIWVKSLTRQYPATVYCKAAPHEAITDFKCRASSEIVIWRGNDDTLVNETGQVEVNCGGLEYHVR